MKIVQLRGDESGSDMKLCVVQTDGRLFIYFQKPGTDKADIGAPYFVIKPGVTYGDITDLVFSLNITIEQFICPNFADGEELKQLRAESTKWLGEAVDPTELEQLRADSAELERMKEKRHEASQLRARLAELEAEADAA